MTTKRLLQLVTNTFMVFLVAFALVGTASAQDQWYVNSTEGDDLNDGSQMDNAGAGVGPFETLAQALSVADDDDTIIVLAGDYTGEDLDLTSGLEDLTFQVQASGLTTVATFDNLVMDTENASLSGGNGSFSVLDATITEVTLTLGANLLQIRSGGTVTMNSDTDVASVAGSNVVLIGSADYFYNSDDDNDIVAGFELPANGDLNGGNLNLGLVDTWDGGSMTFPSDLTVEDIRVEDDVDVTFGGDLVIEGNAEFDDDASVTFEGTVDVDDYVQFNDDRVATFEMAVTGDGYVEINNDTDVTFESSADVAYFDVTNSSSLTIEGAASVDDGNFDSSTDGDVEVASLDLNEFTLVASGAGTFTATGTVTIGDTEVAGTRIDNSGGSEMTLANVVLENTDDTGDDGTAGNADETLEMTISNTGVGSELYLGGTITEAAIVDDNNGDEDIDYVVGIINGDGALFTFGATTSFSGDVDNGTDLFDNATAAPADEGIAIADGVSIISAWPNAYTDLGAWGDGGTLEISEGTAALATIVEVGNFILSADRDITSDPFISTGDVTLEADDATDVVATDVQIDGTLYIVGDAITMDGGGAPDTYVLGGLVVTASGAGDEFTVGDGDDELTIDGGASIIDAVINADITVDGDFSSNGADIEGDFENDGGDSEFEDTTVGGNMIADGDVTIEGDVAFGDVGPGMDDADVTGTLTINGVLTLTNNGADFEIGTLWMDVPDAELYADGMDFTISGDATTSLWDSPGNVEFTIDNNGAATFHPAPNTTVDSFNIDGSDAVLTIAQGFASTNDVYVGNDATLALGINTITIGGDLTLVDEAMVTTDTASGLGAIAFDGGTPEILLEGDPSSTPTLSNIRVNGGASLEVTEADPGNDTLDITGDLSLNDGTFTIPAGVTVNMTGDAATITRNPATGTLVATGDLTGEWDLVYFGGTGTTTDELADGQVKDLTVNMTDGNTLTVDIDAEILGNLHVEDGNWYQDGADIEVGGNFTNGEDLDDFEVDAGELTVAGDFTITEPETADDDFTDVDYLDVAGSLSVPTDVVLDGGDVHLTGDGTTHNNEGNIQSGIYVDAVSVTIVGSTNDDDPDSGVFDYFEVTDGASVTATDVQFTGDWDVDDSDINIMFVDGDDEAYGNDFTLSGTSTMTVGGTTDNPDGIELNDLDINGESTVTFNADFEVSFLNVGDDDDDVIVVDLMGNTVSFNDDGFYRWEDADVSVTDGTIHVQDGADTVFDLYGLVLPNVTIEDTIDDIEITSDFEVSGLLSVLDGADFDVSGGVTITLSGDAFFEDDVVFNDGEFETTGTTITLDGDVDFNDLTISSSSTTQFVADDGDDSPWNITVNNDFTMESGVLDITDEDLLIEGGDFDYNVATGDAIVMNNGEVYFDDTTWSSDGVVVTLANIGTDGTVDMANGDGDGLIVTGIANLDAGAQFDMNVANPGVDATVEFADGSSIIVSETGALDIFELDPTLGMGMSVEYDGGAGTTTGNELAATVANLETDGTDLTLDDDATVLVTGELRIDGDVQFDVSAEDNSVTLGDGALVVFEDAAFFTDDLLLREGDWHVEFDGLATVSDNQWPGGTTATNIVAPLSMTVSDDVAMHENRTTGDLTVDAELDLVTSTSVLTVTGDFFADDDATFVTDEDNYISMGGSEVQMLAFDEDAGTPDALEIDNAAGVTLDGTDLDFSAGGTLILSDGPLNTGDNAVILAHGGTGAQGYTRTNGVINGNVQKYIDTTGGSPNRIEFPTGTAAGAYRPFAVTFNNPGADIGDIDGAPAGPGAANDMLLTASYNGVSAMGTNGLPITTTDSEGNDLSIGRYPDFHWEVTSSPTISPSVDYDVEFQAEGYDNFAQEDIERTRAIRRQAGATTNFWILTSPVAGDNDNYAITSTEPVAVGRNAVGAITGNGVLFTFGLEQNMVATDPSAVAVNADATKDLDLTTVFSGGDGNYTFAVTSADAAVATGVGASNVLTVSGVAAGSTTLTVTATDGFGDTATATVTVNVGTAFVATEVFADFGVNIGAADTTHDGAAATTGGTAPYTYAIASSDATVVAAAIDATSGLVTLTYGVLGTSTITISTTDATGATVDHSFDVTVNVALGANGALADVSVEEGAEADVDASAEFTGGTGDYTYTAASASDANATVAVDGSTVTVTGVSAYTVVAGEVTGDAAPVTVTVTATDEFGGTTTSTFDADVTPVLGNVDGSGGPSPAGASAVLDHFLGLSTLTAKQQTAADFNMDTAITPFDAALIFDAFFNGKDEIVANPVVDFNYGEVAREENIINIPVILTGDLDEVVSASFSTRIDPAMATIVGVTSDLADGWIIKHVIGEDGTINLAFAGNGTLDAEGTIATISIELNNANVQFNLGGEGAANNNTTMSIDAVEVAELPETFALHGNYPNPFNPSTSINFDLPESADVEIQVIDMIGRQVMTLPATTIAAGANRTVQIDASRLASGPYFYRVIAKMESKTLVETGRMMLVK